jgi:hypothetical protein
MLIENEGAIFRGPTRNWPEEIWNFKERRWEAYRGSKEKPYEWGTKIDETQFSLLTAEPVEPKGRDFGTP